MSDKSPDREERIRARAYALWEAEGRQDDKAEHYWHRAREEEAASSDVPHDSPSGSLDDQLTDSFPASDPPSLTSPSYPDEPLPAAPEDEPAPARSATVEERPELPAKAPAKAAKPKAPKAAAGPATAPAAAPAAKPKPAPRSRKS